MSQRCVWVIVVGEANATAQAAAAKLAPYGVAVQGQNWPIDDASHWMSQAQSAAQAGARFVLIAASAKDYQRPDLRRQLSLFRLFLQTLTQSAINGMVMLTDADQADVVTSELPGTALLGDWEVNPANGWAARVVARLHAPKRPGWPVTLGLFAHEKLGTWLQTQPVPGEAARGCLVGVSGHGADISFHAAGQAGCLPENTVNEFSLKGITFTSAGHEFKAWALQNSLSPEQAYFVKLEGEPDLLAISTLPDGEISDVHLMCLR